MHYLSCTFFKQVLLNPPGKLLSGLSACLYLRREIIRVLTLLRILLFFFLVGGLTMLIAEGQVKPVFVYMCCGYTVMKRLLLNSVINHQTFQEN